MHHLLLPSFCPFSTSTSSLASVLDKCNLFFLLVPDTYLHCILPHSHIKAIFTCPFCTFLHFCILHSNISHLLFPGSASLYYKLLLPSKSSVKFRFRGPCATWCSPSEALFGTPKTERHFTFRLVIYQLSLTFSWQINCSYFTLITFSHSLKGILCPFSCKISLRNEIACPRTHRCRRKNKI